MRVVWHCKKCKKDYVRVFNLKANQQDFIIKSIQVECDQAHPKIVEVIS